MARTTLAQQIAETNANVAALAVTVQALAALIDPKAAAKVTKATQPKADRKPIATTGYVFAGQRIGTGSKKLRHSNRKSFIAAHAWAKPGMSTLTLRAAVSDGAKVNKDWSVAV